MTVEMQRIATLYSAKWNSNQLPQDTETSSAQTVRNDALIRDETIIADYAEFLERRGMR